VLAWAGHIATRVDWGQNSAAGIHLRVAVSHAHSGPRTARREPGPVAFQRRRVFPASITITKDASRTTRRTSHSRRRRPRAASFLSTYDATATLSNSQQYANIMNFATYTVDRSRDDRMDPHQHPVSGASANGGTQAPTCLRQGDHCPEGGRERLLRGVHQHQEGHDHRSEKQTSPMAASGNFTFTARRRERSRITARSSVNNVVPGTYTSTEGNPGVGFALTSVVCDDTASANPVAETWAQRRQRSGRRRRDREMCLHEFRRMPER